MTRAQQLLANYQDVTNALRSACERAKRNPQDVTLLAVTKYAKDEDVLCLLQQGVLGHIGESRVQQAWARWKEDDRFAMYSNIQKHFIGHLQKNKAAQAAQLFDWIDSIDDMATVQALAAHMPTGRTLRTLIQVKLTSRATQSGLGLEQARQLARAAQTVSAHIRVCGYMAIAPQGANENELRALFGPLKQAFVQDFGTQPDAQLSLGMSEDFEVAVEEGSTLPRIGSALFSRNLEGI